MNTYEKHLYEIFSIPKSLKANINTLWALEDKKFFSAGACHILAYEYCKDSNYKMYLIQPKNNRGTHVFSSNGEWCFDAFGYQKHSEFLNKYRQVCQSLFGTNWDCTMIQVNESFDDFCLKNNHRNSSKFLLNPFKRAKLFIQDIHTDLST